MATTFATTSTQPHPHTGSRNHSLSFSPGSPPALPSLRSAPSPPYLSSSSSSVNSLAELEQESDGLHNPRRRSHPPSKSLTLSSLPSLHTADLLRDISLRQPQSPPPVQASSPPIPATSIPPSSQLSFSTSSGPASTLGKGTSGGRLSRASSSPFPPTSQSMLQANSPEDSTSISSPSTSAIDPIATRLGGKGATTGTHSPGALPRHVHFPRSTTAASAIPQAPAMVSHGNDSSASPIARRPTKRSFHRQNPGAATLMGLSESSITPHRQYHPGVAKSRRKPEDATREHPARTHLDAKVALLGMAAVGKSSIANRYINNTFSLNVESTIGASFGTKKVSYDGTKVALQIWDTAGQERFRALSALYYRHADAVCVVYDITNYASFLDVESWLEEISDNLPPETIVQVVGTKLDLAPTMRKVELDEACQTIASWRAKIQRRRHEAETGQPAFQGNHERESAPVAASILTLRGLGGFMRPRRSTDEDARHNEDGRAQSLAGEVTEVSSKDDEGIEELFMEITRRLVDRHLEINRVKFMRARDSVILTENPHESRGTSPENSNKGGYTGCC